MVASVMAMFSQRANFSMEFPMSRKENKTRAGKSLFFLRTGFLYVNLNFLPINMMLPIIKNIAKIIFVKLICDEKIPGKIPSAISIIVKNKSERKSASCRSLYAMIKTLVFIFEKEIFLNMNFIAPSAALYCI